jgi:hypothetical protein
MQQQKQVNSNDNIFGYLMNVSYPLASNNVMPANSDNVMFIPSNTMQQKDPKHFTYYPNF